MAKSKKKSKKNSKGISSRSGKISRESSSMILSKAIESARAPASKEKKRIYSIFSAYIVSFFSTCVGVYICQSGASVGLMFFAAAIATLIYAYLLGRKNTHEEKYVIFSKISMVISALSIFISVCMVYYLLTSQTMV